MRRTLLVLLAADAAAKFALEKKGQKVLNVKLYETGYTFIGGDLRLEGLHVAYSFAAARHGIPGFADSNAAPGVYSAPLPLPGDADKLL